MYDTEVASGALNCFATHVVCYVMWIELDPHAQRSSVYIAAVATSGKRSSDGRVRRAGDKEKERSPSKSVLLLTFRARSAEATSRYVQRAIGGDGGHQRRDTRECESKGGAIPQFTKDEVT